MNETVGNLGQTDGKLFKFITKDKYNRQYIKN